MISSQTIKEEHFKILSKKIFMIILFKFFKFVNIYLCNSFLKIKPNGDHFCSRIVFLIIILLHQASRFIRK